jgi:hypothetical protein
LPPDLATVIRETVPPEGVVLIYGDDWNPLLPYYSQRRAVMVPGERENETAVLEQVLARLPPRKIAAMVTVGDKFRRRPEFIRERAARFRLSPQPFASGDDSDLYLPAAAVAPAARILAGRRFQTAQVLVVPVPNPPPDELKVQDLTGTAFPMTAPRPVRARSKFGISIGSADGRQVINANAPSELFFNPPAGTTRIGAVVGLLPAAYARPAPAATDGIEVAIFEDRPDGLRRTLYRRDLAPATVAADRGPQEIELNNVGPFSGQLVFSIGPGPAGNLSYDWAYWAWINIR